MTRLRPVAMIPEYNAGDRLRHEDVNAIVERLKRETIADGVSSPSEGFLVDSPRRRPSLEIEGMYDLPFTTPNNYNKRVPPYAVMFPLEDYIFSYAQGRRGVQCKQLGDNGSGGYYASTVFYVNSRVPLAAAPSGYTNGLCSTLITGGWVAVSLKDESGNDVNTIAINDPAGTDTFSGPTYGPKPGSWVLWPYRSGFRVFGPLYTFADSDYTNVGIGYAYQTTPIQSPLAFTQGALSGSFASTSYGQCSVALSTADSDGADSDLTRWRRGVLINSASITIFDSGAYEFRGEGLLRPLFSGGFTSSTVGSGHFASIAPFFDGSQVGAARDFTLDQIKDHDSNLLSPDKPFAVSWFFNVNGNALNNKEFALKIKINETTNLVSATIVSGHFTLRKFSDVAHKLFA